MAVESEPGGRTATRRAEHGRRPCGSKGSSSASARSTAVDGIDLEIADGEFFSMLGPSGSGKTTTLRMIAGFEEPTEGTIRLHGRDVTGVPPFDRDVNTVFQDYALFPHMTRRRQRRLRPRGAAACPAAERRTRVAEAMRDGPARRATRRGVPASSPAASASASPSPARSSTGPRVLLLDEPLGALDLKLREEMQIELKAIQAQVGITFVYVTHDQEEALTMSDRLAVFNHGRIEQIGTPADVYEHPATTFVAGLRRNVEPAAPVRRRAPSSASDGVFTVRPEKIRIADPDRRSRPTTRASALGTIREVVYLGPDTRYIVALDDRQRARRHAAEPADIVDGGARRPGPSRAARLEAPPRAEPCHERGNRWGHRRKRPSHETPARFQPCWLRARPAGRSVYGIGRAGEMHRRSSARARASSTSSSGPATPRTARPFPDFDWVTPFEEETGCIVNAQTQADSATGVRACCSPASTTAGRSPATRPIG